MKLKGSPSSEQTPLLQSGPASIGRQERAEDRHRSTGEDAPSDIYAEHGHLLNDALYPDDSFDGHTYWADLPPNEKSRWMKQQYNLEAKREFAHVWQLFKQNPLSPLKRYLVDYAVGGTGFFTEGYVLFSVGNVMPLLKSVWPECWSKFTACDEQMLDAVKYMEILGVSECPGDSAIA